MKAKNTALILAASVAFIALSGCVENIPDSYCMGEGDTIPVIANPPECCPGLTSIPPKQAGVLGISGICTANCGNGICDEATESSYNCIADCPVAEAQDYYNSDQEAFDALQEEINGLEEPSPSELEAMLGQ